MRSICNLNTVTRADSGTGNRVETCFTIRPDIQNIFSLAVSLVLAQFFLQASIMPGEIYTPQDNTVYFVSKRSPPPNAISLSPTTKILIRYGSEYGRPRIGDSTPAFTQCKPHYISILLPAPGHPHTIPLLISVFELLHRFPEMAGAYHQEIFAPRVIHCDFVCICNGSSVSLY